jgi:hypothetical protein
MSATQSIHETRITPPLRHRSWIVPLAVPVAIGLIVAIIGLVAHGGTSATNPRLTSSGPIDSKAPTTVTVPVQAHGYARGPVTHALLPSSVATSRSGTPSQPADNPAPPIPSSPGAS